MKAQLNIRIVALALLSLAPTAARAQHDTHHSADSAAVAGAVAKFHEALAAGDSVAALALLTDDVRILEGGRVETKAEYRSRHLAADINASKSGQSQQGALSVRIQGDVAWTTSTSTTQRTVNGNAVTSSLAELMVLVKTQNGWKISAIHWSSGRRS